MSTGSTSSVSSTSSSAYNNSPASVPKKSLPVAAMASGGQPVLSEPVGDPISLFPNLAATAAATHSEFQQALMEIVSSTASSPSSPSLASLLSPSSSSAASHANAVSVSSPLQSQNTIRLSRKQIYEQIGEILCQIKTPKETATGFCIEKNLIAVPFHLLEETDTWPKPIECFYKDVSYTARYCTFFSLDVARRIDCAIFEVQEVDFPPFPKIELFDREIQPGEQVYFGGFPLLQEDPTFHSGFVSSVSKFSEIPYFTIDGTIVPGNSGGPVFILDEERLKLAGFIDQQMADINPEFVRARREIRQPLSQATVHVSGVNLNLILLNIVDTVFDNLSTGIGRAIHVRNFKMLVEREVVVLSPVPYPVMGIPVAHGTLKIKTVSKEEISESVHRQVKVSVYKSVVGFFNDLRRAKASKKIKLYSKLDGQYGRIYTSHDPDWRLDRQNKPPGGAADIQVQVGDYTIATLLISPCLLNYGDNYQKIAQVVNYIGHKFIGAVNCFNKNRQAVVQHISPRDLLTPEDGKGKH